MSETWKQGHLLTCSARVQWCAPMHINNFSTHYSNSRQFRASDELVNLHRSTGVSVFPHRKIWLHRIPRFTLSMLNPKKFKKLRVTSHECGKTYYGEDWNNNGNSQKLKHRQQEDNVAFNFAVINIEVVSELLALQRNWTKLLDQPETTEPTFSIKSFKLRLNCLPHSHVRPRRKINLILKIKSRYFIKYTTKLFIKLIRNVEERPV